MEWQSWKYFGTRTLSMGVIRTEVVTGSNDPDPTDAVMIYSKTVDGQPLLGTRGGKPEPQSFSSKQAWGPPTMHGLGPDSRIPNPTVAANPGFPDFSCARRSLGRVCILLNGR
jgi:hypothetical protein